MSASGEGKIAMQRKFLSYMSLTILASAALLTATPAAAQILVQEAKLLSDDGAQTVGVGRSAAVSGDTAVVGADDAAFAFVNDGMGWAQQAKLIRDDGQATDSFGAAVAVSGDTAVVGAKWNDELANNAGAAYVFIRNGTVWTQQAKLLPDDNTGWDEFGFSVAVSGGTAVIGAYRHNGLAGAAYVFVRSGTTWTQQAKLVPDDNAGGNRFGYSVVLSGDIAVIGASWGDSEATDNTGAAYEFVRAGTNWAQQAKLVPDDGVFGDTFGDSVSLSGDTIVIGNSEDDDFGTSSGSAYVFNRSGMNWTQQAKLLADDAAAFDFFGSSVAISGDRAVIGARWNDGQGSSSGAAYEFVRNGTNWIQRSRLLAVDVEANDFFGVSVALSGDTAIIGAPGDDDFSDGSGAAYVFSPDAVTPTLYGIDGGILNTINPATGAPQSFTSLTVPGDPLPLGGFGLAVSPISNDMYAVVKLLSGSGFNRNLVKVNPYTGIATVIGSMDQSIDGLAFDSNGTLYAVSGDCVSGCGGVPTPETLFTVNLNDASLTFIQTLGNGDNGEAIAFNSNDGLMYHMSGEGAGLIFESIDLSDGTITPVPLSGSMVFDRVTSALVFDTSQNLFLGSLIDLQIFTFVTLTPAGELTDIGDLGSEWTDFAFLNVGQTDTDGDGIPNDGDAFPIDPAEWADTDGDGVGDNADAFSFDPSETVDTDSDGVGDNADTDDDGDTMPDDFELANGLDPLNAADATADADGDGFTNLKEFRAGTDPQNADDFPPERKVPVAIFILLGDEG